ncbi:MAG: hypothetical protein PQJ61_02750 [Spirochaetales bacterium]|uniref:Nitrogen regulatory protein P-II n=1 Tax=Candidatus Thalassospirochaeta sargassi TaxID=3119039 RepID=A0AAJ1IGA7_9SPIO|nr:hypothetical protein [Spirochaetales bacterium]
MKRVEIITNQAIAEDILDSLEAHNIAENYTIIPHIHGRGKKGTRLGSPLWPEENCIYILYIDDDNVQIVKDVIKGIKDRFPNEGTKMFISPVEE